MENECMKRCPTSYIIVTVLCLVTQSSPTLCDPMECSPPAFSVHRILQARILEWVALPSSRGIFLTQRWSPRLLCPLPWQVGSLPLGPPGKPPCTHHISSTCSTLPGSSPPHTYRLRSHPVFLEPPPQAGSACPHPDQLSQKPVPGCPDLSVWFALATV